MSRNYVDGDYIIHHQELLFIIFALIKLYYFQGIINVIIHVLHVKMAQTLQQRTIVNGLAEIAAHFAKFRIIYCYVDNTCSCNEYVNGLAEIAAHFAFFLLFTVMWIIHAIVMSTSMKRIKTPHLENMFIKIVNYLK